MPEAAESGVLQPFDTVPRPVLLFGVVALFTLGAALNLARSWFSERFQWRLREDWILRIMRNFLEMPYLEFRSRRLGGLMEVLGTETRMGAMCIWELVEGSARVIYFVVLVLVFVATDWRAALVVATFAVALALVARPRLFRRSTELGQLQIELNQSWKAVATESLLGFREIKILGKEREATEALKDDLSAMTRAASLRRLLRSAPNALSTLAFVLLALSLIGARQLFAGVDWTSWVPVLGFAIVLSRRLMILAAAVVSHSAAFRGHLPSLAFVKQHLEMRDTNLDRLPEAPGERGGEGNREPDLEPATLRRRLSQTGGPGPEISFEGVDFSYPGKPALFRGLSFTLPAGKVSVLMGRSGAGKSTIADLLLGLVQPTAGAIRIGGEALHDLDPKAWREVVGYVSQESFFFNATVRANLQAARADASDEALLEACRVAGAEVFLNRLPDGLDTVLGERGPELSGGERQRLAIARAILRKPPLLVLDEVTSAVDPQTAVGIWERLSSLGSVSTVLVLSHGVPAGLRVDQALYLENGQIQRGTVPEKAVSEGETAS